MMHFPKKEFSNSETKNETPISKVVVDKAIEKMTFSS